MSTGHYALYIGLGLTLVLLGVWRMTAGSAASRLKPAGLVIGAAMLALMVSGLLGIVSLTGVEACLQEKGGGRSKLITCLFRVEMASR